MNKILIILILLLVGFYVNAEEWNCIYKHHNEQKIIHFSRVNNTFYQIDEDGTMDKTGYITVQESSNQIVLIDIIEFEKHNISFLVTLNKIKKGFAMIGLQYPDSTDIISGKCIVSN